MGKTGLEGKVCMRDIDGMEIQERAAKEETEGCTGATENGKEE